MPLPAMAAPEPGISLFGDCGINAQRRNLVALITAGCESDSREKPRA